MNRMYISPDTAQAAAMATLARWGLPFSPVQPFTDKPVRVRGRNRNGKHRGHTNPMTSRNSKKK